MDKNTTPTTHGKKSASGNREGSISRPTGCRFFVGNRKKEWRKKNPEKEAISKKKYFIKHKDAIYERTRKWRNRNHDKIVQYRKTYATKNPLKVQEKNFRTKIFFLRKLDLTFEQFNDLLVLQKGLCAICDKPESSVHQSGTKRLLSIDHDHDTNKVRGLLCKKCNTAIGMLGDDPKLVMRAYEYLIK